MTLLKLKAIIYKYTGCYLAEPELNAYLASQEYCDDYNYMMLHAVENDLSESTITSILIGSWQGRNGFSRPISFVGWGSSNIAKKALHELCTLGIVLKWDLIYLKRKIEGMMK